MLLPFMLYLKWYTTVPVVFEHLATSKDQPSMAINRSLLASSSDCKIGLFLKSLIKRQLSGQTLEGVTFWYEGSYYDKSFFPLDPISILAQLTQQQR